MANASDSLGHSNSSASAPIDVFTLSDAEAMGRAQQKENGKEVDKIDQANSKENSKGNPKAAAKAEKQEEQLVNGV